MLISEVTQEFRNQVRDTEVPFLWSEDEVLGYLIDAQDELCRFTGGFSDLTTRALTDLTITALNPWSTFSPYILRIRSATLLNSTLTPSQPTPIRIAQEGDLPLLNGVDDYFSNFGYDESDYGLMSAPIVNDADTGDVKAMILGLDEYKARWYKVPNVDNIARLHIFRLPYPRITPDSTKLEVAEQYHRGLILRMRELAYNKQDAETYDRTAADKYKLEFEAFCAKVKRERQRLVYRPRTVMYSGV